MLLKKEELKKCIKPKIREKNKITEISNNDINFLLKELKLSKIGISDSEIDNQKLNFGSNEIKIKKPNNLKGLLKIILSPFNIILMVINLYSLFNIVFIEFNSIELFQFILVFIMILISVCISFFQELKTQKKFKEQKKSIIWSRVIRNLDVKYINDSNYIDLYNEIKKINSKDLVAGDLIYLANGHIVPCDARIIYVNNLTVDESRITGESYPVRKEIYNNKNTLLDLENIIYTNTIINSGFCMAIVMNVGERCLFSKIESEKTYKTNSFNKSIFNITLLLISFMLVITPIILTIVGVKTGNWFDALFFTIAIAIGLTPEMLPIIISLNLVNGISKLDKNKIQIKNLSGIQNLGSIDTLCIDKTGTLTKGYIELQNIQNINGEIVDIDELLFSSCSLQTGFNNSIDKAIKDKFKNIYLENKYIKLNEIPFDFERRKSTLVLQHKNNSDKKIVISKGAVHEIIKSCKKINIDGKIFDLDINLISKIKDAEMKINSNGYRAIAIATKETGIEDSKDDESNLTFLALAKFGDQIKKQAKRFLKELNKLGVEPKILTGDNKLITEVICKKNDLKIKGMISGEELDLLEDSKYLKAITKNNVFVKLNPHQKQRIIETLKSIKKKVGYIGDGYNDIPSLKSSDISITFDDCSESVKQNSDCIIYDDNLNEIVKSISQGRISFCNIMKYIKITISSNIGNIISILIATLWLTFNPMQPIQILLQNLIYDLSQIGLVNDNVDKQFIKKPQAMNIKRIYTFCLFNGPVSSIFDIATFTILFFMFNMTGQNTEQIQGFNSGWFMVGLLTQTLVVLVYRTNNFNMFKLRIKKRVLIIFSIIWLLSILIPFSIVGNLIQFGNLSLLFIPIGIGIVFLYLLTATLFKYIYQKIFKSWL